MTMHFVMISILAAATVVNALVEVYPKREISYAPIAYSGYRGNGVYPEGYYGGNGHYENEPGDHYLYPNYKFAYGVNDPHTGDHKSHQEERDGDVVKGFYTVADPDGTLRTVHYTADGHNGFNAVVQKEGQAVHPVPIYKKEILSVVPVYKKEVLPIYEKQGYGGGYGGYGHGYGVYGGQGYY